jgi:hypothetical protein
MLQGERDGDFNVMSRMLSKFDLPRSVSALAVATAVLVGGAGERAAFAAGPFKDFSGSWSGTGTLQVTGGNKERIRCTANYRGRGSSGSEVDIVLKCASDTYKFELSGDIRADNNASVSGQWTERTRGIGGSLIGRARGERLQLHAESSGFAADIVMQTRDRRQSVSIDSQGGGQKVQASITLRRE